MNKMGYSSAAPGGRDVGIVILAAGNSSRLGRPKQLLPFRGKTLLMHVISEALAAALRPVVVVTGAFEAEVVASLMGQTEVVGPLQLQTEVVGPLQLQTEVVGPLQRQAVNIVHNPHWETGMASGLIAGLGRALSIQPGLHAIIVAVCDQPFIAAALLRALVDNHGVSGKGLIASGYAGVAGTPVLFDRRYFPELLALSGDGGARSLLKRYPGDVSMVPFPKGEIDIDNEDDFQRLTIGG
jgi:molybdenum cofactor cytidylyltransferase